MVNVNDSDNRHLLHLYQVQCTRVATNAEPMENPEPDNEVSGIVPLREGVSEGAVRGGGTRIAVDGSLASSVQVLILDNGDSGATDGEGIECKDDGNQQEDAVEASLFVKDDGQGLAEYH